MSGTTLTIRPAPKLLSASDWTVVGGGTYDSVLADNSDATYVQNVASAGFHKQAFADCTLPALSQIRAVTPRYRFRLAATVGQTDSLVAALSVIDVLGAEDTEPYGTDWISVGTGGASGAWLQPAGKSRPLDPLGNPWTLLTLQSIRVQFRSNLTIPWAQCQVSALYLDILYNQAPGVTATAPAGTVTTTTRPPVVWTYLDPDGDPQESFVARIYSAAQIAAASLVVTTKVLTTNVATLTTLAPHSYAAGDTVTVASVDATFNGTWVVTGVTPNTFSYALLHADIAPAAAVGTVFSPDHAPTVFWDSGLSFTNSTTVIPDVDLPNGSYSAYVHAADTGSNGRNSMWSTSAFTIAVLPPPAPVLTAAYDDANYRNVLTAWAATNLATANQADVETDATGFTAISFCTLARSTAQHSSGVASLAVTSTGAGAPAASTLQDSGTIGGTMLVVPNALYTAYAELRANTTVRSCRVGIMWFNAANTWIGTTWGSLAPDTNTGWTVYTLVGATSPATAYSAAVTWEIQGVAGAGEIHYVDKIGLWPGSGTTWSRGGLSGATFSEMLVIEFSDDGGTTWARLYGSPFAPSLYQGVTAYDYTLPATVARTYRARVTAVDSAGNVLTSANSAATAPLTFSIPRGRWRLVDPVTPANSVFIRARMPDEEKTENLAVFRPLGRPDPFAVSSSIDVGWSGTLTFVTLTDAEAAAVDPIISARNPLWLTSPSGVYRLYIRLLSPRKRPKIAAVARQWSAPFIAVRRP